MALENVALWIGALFIEWFFLIRSEVNGWKVLGWASWILTGIVGMWIFETDSMTHVIAFVMGATIVIIGILQMVKNLTDDYED